MADTQAYRDQLQAESLRLFPGTSKDAKKKRKGWRNAQRVAAGYKKEGRGGAAGVWDRNKNIIVPLAAGAASLLTGGLAAPIAVGALARGLDREGEGGIGFDVGQAARGGLEGGLAGTGATALGGAVNAARMGAAGASGAGLNPVWGAVRGVGEAARDVVAPVALGAQNLGLNRENALQTLNAGVTAYNRAQAMNQMRKATRTQEREWRENAPLRLLAREQMLSGIAGNPFDVTGPVGVR